MGMGPIWMAQRDPNALTPQQQYQQQFEQSANARVPGVNPSGLLGSAIGAANSQYMNQTFSPADWIAMLPPAARQGMGEAPPQQQLPAPMSRFQAVGPYGGQAMRMAGMGGGLLGGGSVPSPGQPTMGYQGLLGGGGSMDGGMKRGFRLPYGGK